MSATQTEKQSFKLADWLSDRFARALISGSKLLPYEMRVKAFGALMEGPIGALTGYRKRAEDQLAFIYPEMSAEDRQKIARGVCNNTGRTFIENYCAHEFARQVEKSAIFGDGLAAIDEAKAQGRPVLFVTGHFGNYEAPRVALTQMGHSVGGLYRKMSNRYFNRHYERNMLELSGEVYAQGHKGTAKFVRMLSKGGMGSLLFDIRATAFDNLPFMGKPAPTAPSAAKIALKLNALVIPYFGVRREDGLTFDIHVESPIALTDAETMMIDMTKRLEARVEANPEQWFWVHRRWAHAGQKGQGDSQ